MDLQEQLNNNWCNNMDLAPKEPIKVGEKVLKEKTIDITKPVIIWVTDGKIVTKSYWVNGERWNMFTKDSPPIAWQPYLIPEFNDIEKQLNDMYEEENGNK